MEYICQSCKQGAHPRKWFFFGTVCPNCKESYKPNTELAPYYQGLIGAVGVKANGR